MCPITQSLLFAGRMSDAGVEWRPASRKAHANKEQCHAKRTVESGRCVEHVFNSELFRAAFGARVQGDVVINPSQRLLLYEDIAEMVASIARARGHRQANEFHLLKCLIECAPSDVARGAKNISDIVYRAEPLGSEWHSRLLAVLTKKKDLEGICKLQEQISEPITFERINEVCDAYLASSFYPYGPREFEKFHEMPRDSQRAQMLTFFAAHAMTEWE